SSSSSSSCHRSERQAVKTRGRIRVRFKDWKVDGSPPKWHSLSHWKWRSITALWVWQRERVVPRVHGQMDRFGPSVAVRQGSFIATASRQAESESIHHRLLLPACPRTHKETMVPTSMVSPPPQT